MVDYRGYGHSEGQPNEEGLMRDADAVIAYLTAHPEIAGSRIVLYGQSLGGAVALYAAEKHADKVGLMAMVVGGRRRARDGGVHVEGLVVCGVAHVPSWRRLLVHRSPPLCWKTRSITYLAW